ncbi:hypothetical protein KSF_111420 [Reticulibacter mediterranei]|uniref:Methyltransferase domain-containing protein n=1 Tax=Reticulibacter mediterranei TaxID=2778369 RepID=A0A8J3N7D5_9CHLR|nr:class I SAM-dependent methyltransferase [Reticulibacter mediterranei]GHP01095.1 hypothetical protein KSF_111420 [Reticulibacter mediterranei]
MSTPADPRREVGGTYFVQNRDNLEELSRLHIQDRMLTASMGGVLPEQGDPARLRRVLDVGCGTGGWLVEAAKTYLDIERSVGIDVNRQMIAAAHQEAQAQQVSARVQFRLMDALQMLKFPSDSFDLVNQRLAMSWLRTWEWPKMLREEWRVTRPGGVIRLTEVAIVTESSSPAYLRLCTLILHALYRAGHYFNPTPDGLTSQLVPLLHQFGVENVQTRLHAVRYRAGTAEGQHFAEDMRLVSRTLAPYVRKWGQMPDDYQALCKQMLQEFEQPDFFAVLNVLTAWGTKSQPPTKTASGREQP